MLITSPGEPAKMLRTIANSVQSFCTATFSKPNYLETAAASKLDLSARASLFRKVVAELIESLEENRRSR
jgi:hypothetical protein